MSIRIRLSLLYALIAFSFLAIFGVGLISLFTSILYQQVDGMLTHDAAHFLEDIRVDEDKNFSVRLLPITTDLVDQKVIVYQIWDQFGHLAYQSVDNNLENPLIPLMNDGSELTIGQTGMSGYRVITQPLIIDGIRFGTLQLGYDLSTFSLIENRLVRQMVIFVVLAVIVTGGMVSILLNRDVKRITMITDTVVQINKSDDPSLRIENKNPIKDEIGDLIVAFNETMERLESILNSQRRFLADVSHELRTPMTIIKGNVDIMRRFGELDDESLNTIEAQTDRLTRLVNSLLLLEQVESGQVQVQKTAVNIADLLLEVFQELVLIAEYKGQHMQVVEIDLGIVAGNRDQLKQVLLNLVSNAINYTPDGGDVLLSMRKENNELRIGIRDTGSGIPEEDIPHLFERFYRGEKSRAWHRTSGFGLGLSIAYWIVRNHNGRIIVESKVGEGSEFIVYLPLTGQGLDKDLSNLVL